MRKIRVTVTDEVKSNSALCRVTPSVINLGGIAGEHNATRIVYVLPDSWDTDTGSFFVECESNNGEAALSDELFVTEENGEKQIYFDIPYGMTAAGTAEFTLKHNFYAEDNKTLEKSVRSAKLRVRFSDSTEVSAENRKLAEDLLGGMSAQINDLLKRFYDGEFNGKDGMPGEKGDKGDAGVGLEELRALLEQSESNNSLFYNERNNLVTEDSGGNLYIPFQEILQNFPAEDFSFYSNVSYNGTYLWGVNHEFFHEDSKAVLLVFVDECTANGDNVKNTNMVFVNGEFNTADSYVEELIDGEMVYSPLAEPIEYFKLPVFDKFESDYSDTDITLFYSPLRVVSALADAIKKAHVHLNLKTLSKFYCDTAEAESNDGLPPILPDHIGADRIKYNGIYLRYCSDGGVIVDGTEVTDPETGEKVFRVDLDNGPLVTGKKLAFFDIPITGTKEVTKESPEPGIGTQSVGLQLQLGGSGSTKTIPIVSTLPETAKDGDVVLYVPNANTINIGDGGRTVVFNWSWVNDIVLNDGDEIYMYSDKAEDATQIFDYKIIRYGANLFVDIKASTDERAEIGTIYDYRVAFIQTDSGWVFNPSNSVLKKTVWTDFYTSEVETVSLAEPIAEIEILDEINSVVYSDNYEQFAESNMFFYILPEFMIYSGGAWDELISVPTKTSELENDSGFITSEQLNDAIAEIRGGIDEIEAMIDESGVLE